MKYLLTALIVLFGVVLAQDSSQSTQSQSAQTALVSQEMSALRVAHLVTNNSNFTILIDGEPFLDNLASGTVSSYLLLPAGEHSFEIYQTDNQSAATGTDDSPSANSSADQSSSEATNETQDSGSNRGQQDQSLGSKTLSLEAGNFYTLLAYSNNQTSSSDSSSADSSQSNQNQSQGSLSIEVKPSDATITVTGPNGFARELSESDTLTNLETGSYIVAATLQGYESNNQTVEVRPSETASVSLDLKQISEESDQEQSSSDTEQAEQTSSANETNTSETNTSSNSSEDADSDRSAQTDSEMTNQNNNVALKLVQDELQVAPAGAALLKVIHVSSNSPDINVVIARTQNEPSQTPQSNDEEQTEGSSQTAETEMNQEDQATSETSTDSAETSTETNQNDANQNSTTSETEQANQQGSLSITISPSQAQNATITVTGPDDFTRELTGEGMLEGLKPGTYHVDATQTSYQPAAAEVEVTANSTAHASITLERLPEAGPVPIEGQNLFNQLAFESSSDYQVIPSGTFSLQLQQVDQDIQIAEVQDFSIEPGGTYSLIIYDQADQNNVALAIAVDVFAPQSEQNDQPTPSQDDSSQSDDTPETESEAN